MTQAWFKKRTSVIAADHFYKGLCQQTSNMFLLSERNTGNLYSQDASKTPLQQGVNGSLCMESHILQLHKQLSNKTRTAPATCSCFTFHHPAFHSISNGPQLRQLRQTIKLKTNCGTLTDICSKPKLHFLHIQQAHGPNRRNSPRLLCESKDLALKTLQTTSKKMIEKKS